MKTDIFAIQSTCMEVSVSLSCLFVHEPPYQTTVVCCNAIFRRGSSRMEHRTVFHVRVGLAQARPNKGDQMTKPIIYWPSYPHSFWSHIATYVFVMLLLIGLSLFTPGKIESC